MFANKFATGNRSQNIEAGIKEKIHMQKYLKYFFQKKDFGTVFRSSCAVPIKSQNNKLII